MNLLTTVLSSTGFGLHAAAWGLAIARWRTSGIPHQSYGLMACGSFLLFLSACLDHSIGFAALQAALAGIYVWLWWRNGGGRRMKKIARELGAKSKARVDALVEQMQPSPISVPGGAR